MANRSLLFFLPMSASKIIVVGCGVVGAMVAYELSHQLAANVVVLEKGSPAQSSTGAALGVLMGVISSKVKGRTWRLREASIRRYPALIEALAEQGYSVPFNTHGIVSLCYDETKLPRWETLKEKRQTQGWPLEIWTPEALKERCPQVSLGTEDQTVKAAIYSPADRQVHPQILTSALVEAAKKRGVTFYENAEVTQLEVTGQRCSRVQTTRGTFEADWIVLTAGLGSAALTQLSDEPLELMPVLGQAMEVQLPATLGNHDFQPVINGYDIQFVPVNDRRDGRYWLGATVEFPSEDWPQNGAEMDKLTAKAEGLVNLRKGAESFVGAIAQATVLKTWSGLRPRPVGQPAPVIKPLAGTDNITLATGHYRNGVLLAPATAQQVCDLLKPVFPQRA